MKRYFINIKKYININLTTEIIKTNLGTIVIKNVDNVVTNNQILYALITHNLDTLKSIYNYRITNVKYDKATLNGSAEVHSTNWLSKQEIKVTYKIQVA